MSPHFPTLNLVFIVQHSEKHFRNAIATNACPFNVEDFPGCGQQWNVFCTSSCQRVLCLHLLYLRSGIMANYFCVSHHFCAQIHSPEMSVVGGHVETFHNLSTRKSELRHLSVEIYVFLPRLILSSVQTVREGFDLDWFKTVTHSFLNIRYISKKMLGYFF